MKVHIGADEETGVVHSVAMTSANVHDVTETHRLLHGGETRVWAMRGIRESISGRRTESWMWSGAWR